MASPAGSETAESGRGPTLSLFGGRGRLLALGAAVLFILWLARGIIGPFVIAAILAYAFSPVVSAIEERTRAPRVLIIGVGYVVVLGLIGVVAFFAAERAGMEFSRLSSSGQDVIGDALRKLLGDTIVVAGQTYKVTDIASSLRDAILGLVRTPSGAVQLAERAVSIALQAVLTLILTFYLLLDGHRFREFALHFLDRSQRAYAVRILGRIHLVLGRWLRGQLLLIVLVATVLYAILGPILHVPYALAIAILSGVLEIIPLLGPLIAAGLAGTVAFGTRGTDTAIVVIVVYTILRQIEDQVVMPLVIGRAVHLHPVVTIFAVIVGLSVWGVLGGLLGVPVAAALNVTLRELYPEEISLSPEPRPARRLRVPLRGRMPGRMAAPGGDAADAGTTAAAGKAVGGAAASGPAGGAGAVGAADGAAGGAAGAAGGQARKPADQAVKRRVD